MTYEHFIPGSLTDCCHDDDEADDASPKPYTRNPKFHVTYLRCLLSLIPGASCYLSSGPPIPGLIVIRGASGPRARHLARYARARHHQVDHLAQGGTTATTTTTPVGPELDMLTM